MHLRTPIRFLRAIWVILCLVNIAAWAYIIQKEYVENVWLLQSPFEHSHPNVFLFCRIGGELFGSYIMFAIGLWRGSWVSIIPCMLIESFSVLFYFLFFGGTMLLQPQNSNKFSYNSAGSPLDIFMHVTQILFPCLYFVLAACSIALILIWKRHDAFSSDPDISGVREIHPESAQVPLRPIINDSFVNERPVPDILTEAEPLESKHVEILNRNYMNGYNERRSIRNS